MRHAYSFVFALNLLIVNGLSAQLTVSGTVSSTLGEPLFSVSVLEKGTQNGTLTDFDGHFKINVSRADATLQASFLGFISKEITLDGRAELDIILEEDTKKLAEVVVTAFGIERQKRELGYSTEKVKGETVLRSNSPNLVNSLAGRMAGVNVTQPNGVEGGTTRFVIRGNNNITGDNQPLIIVDGVPLENAAGFGESPAQKEITGGRDWGSAINNINPADIESLDILKGANAAALYGARGKNGVVLISLKKGAARRGLGVEYNFNARSIRPYRFRDVQNTFGAGGPVSENAPSFEKNDAGELIYPTDINTINGPGGKPSNESFGYYGGSQSWGPRMDGTMIKWWDGVQRPFDAQPDNIKLFYKNGLTTSHNVAFAGGSAGGTIRASLTRTDHEAITLNSNYAQNTVNLGGSLAVSKRLRADVSMNYFDFQRKNTPALSNDAANSFESGMVYSLPRSYKGENFDYKNADGTRRAMPGWPYLYVSPYQIWNVYNNNTTLRRDKWLGSLGLNFEATDWLTLTGRAGVDNTNDEMETRRNPVDITGTIIDDGSGGFSNNPGATNNVGYEHNLGKQKVINAEGYLNFHKKNLTRGLDGSLRLGGAQWARRDYGIYGIGSDRWRDPLLYAFSNYKNDPANPAAGLPKLDEFFYQKKLNSAFGFLDLGWRNCVFAQITGRNDWSSTLPLDNNSYFYPSANISFVATEAFRDKIPKKISHLKTRLAASQTGSDDEPYQLSKIINSGVFNGQNTGSLPNQIPPIGLRPQRAKSYEGGLEMGFFDDRLTGDVTFYYLNSYDQLLESPVPNSSGHNFIRINTGQLSNRGIEAILTARIIQNRGFSWNSSINFAKNRSRLEQLDAGADLLELANVWASNGPSISVKKGEPYGNIVGFDYVRDEATGKSIVSDDGKFFKLTETKVPIRIFDKNGKFLRYANATPRFTAGWVNTFTFKNWTLSTLFDAKIGGDMWFGTYALGLQSGQSPETLLEREGGGLPFTDPSGETRNVGVILDGVHADGQPNDKIVHYYYKYLNSGGWGRANTAPAVKENTWIKCREISLAWQMPGEWATKTRVFQGLSVALTGRDLFYFYATAPDNINPEGSIGAGNAQGLEFGSLPGVRTFGVSLGGRF